MTDLRDQPTYRVTAVGLGGAPADLSIHCDRCPWWAHVDRPITLAELNRRVEDHAEEHHQ